MLRLLCAAALLLGPVQALANARLINGKPVDKGTYREVINLNTNGAGCTATIIGPKVLITAAHCAANGATASFQIDAKTYSAKMYRSPLYPAKDHDIAIGIATEDIAGVDPASIGGTATEGQAIWLLGFGCVAKPPPGQPPQIDGILRIGDTVITGFSNYDMVSRKADGAALCFGDSGGPAYILQTGGKKLLLGISSKGNIQDTNYNTRTDIKESQDFLKQVAQEQSVEICGINKECGSGPPPPPPAPTCNLVAAPSTVKKGEVVHLSLTAEGQATAATIDGTTVSLPTGTIQVTTTAIGTFSSKGKVTGPGGSGECSASYTVQDGPPPPPPAPSCSLVANPDVAKIGEKISLELTTQGQVTAAAINGTSVPFPSGKLSVTATAKGTFTVGGSATGPGGTGSCTATYQVTDGPTPPPETPNFAVVPTYCGENKFLDSKVSQVCLAILKKDASIADLKMNQVILITYTDATKEVMPILARKARPKDPSEATVKEDLTFYANGSVKGKNFQILDVRTGVLTSGAKAGDLPQQIEGRTATGKYFLVEKLSPFSVSLF